MDDLFGQRFLCGRFRQIDCEYHHIELQELGTSCHNVYHDSDLAHKPPPKHFFEDVNGDLASSRCGTLRCVFQRSRIRHVSGHADYMPFKDADTMDCLFAALKLPRSYIQIADGNLSVIQSITTLDARGRPKEFEFVSHCISKQGDWAMALKHERTRRSTSVFWSVDAALQPNRLIVEMTQHCKLAFHPLLLPSIMFAETLQRSTQRRASIKAKLRVLEEGARALSQDPAFTMDSTDHSLGYAPPYQLDELFELLASVKQEQASREGRYQLWSSFHEALQEGLGYWDAISSEESENTWQLHDALKNWIIVAWAKFESMKARDMDHVQRVDNLTHVLYDVIHLRNNRTQLAIARASKADSEDMKFIAVLGAIFLPASLAASILNVPEFQFLPGAKLFGVYLAITIPCAAALVTILFSRHEFHRWWSRALKQKR